MSAVEKGGLLCLHMEEKVEGPQPVRSRARLDPRFAKSKGHASSLPPGWRMPLHRLGIIIAPTSQASRED